MHRDGEVTELVRAAGPDEQDRVPRRVLCAEAADQQGVSGVEPGYSRILDRCGQRGRPMLDQSE